MNRSFVFSCTLLACALCGADTVYQSTDKNGHPVFTDQPHPGAKTVEVGPTNTSESAPSVAPPESQPDAPSVGYTRVKLNVPSSIPNGLAPTTIGIDLRPPLQPRHRWQLLLDGQAQGEGTEGAVTLDQMERGSHQLQLNVLDAKGNIVGSSPSTEVFVYWPGKNR